MAVQTSNPQPASSLAADKSLRPFLAANFDPADYLNATLPSWNPSQPASQGTVPSLADISNQTQSVVTQLNAQLTRLSSTLTQLTDEILRSGTRLAYEVEVLRGDASSLSDVMTGRLKKEIETFVQPEEATAAVSQGEDAKQAQKNPAASSRETAAAAASTPATKTDTDIARLHTLSLVRDRLDSVIQVFGEASKWPIAPSEVLSKSNFISVAGPESSVDDAAQEAKAREYEQALRAELLALVGDSSGSDADAAVRRVESLRRLAEVWKGTSEEKARIKVVDALAKTVEDKKKANAGGGYGLGTNLANRQK